MFQMISFKVDKVIFTMALVLSHNPTMQRDNINIIMLLQREIIVRLKSPFKMTIEV